MKKLTFLSVLVIMIVTLGGCRKGNVSIKTSGIEANTMLIKSDGIVQVATVEEFNESYYDMDELREYINDNLAKFNEEVGNETAVVLDDLDKKRDKAIMVLEYQNLDYYAQFNEVEAKQITKLTAKELEELPTTFESAQEEESISKSDLATLENINVVVLEEEYNLIVSEKIKYYANGTLNGAKEIHTFPEGTVVVY